jgi:threonine/homoserine/homoserine lactone efflux protein
MRVWFALFCVLFIFDYLSNKYARKTVVKDIVSLLLGIIFYGSCIALIYWFAPSKLLTNKVTSHHYEALIL